MDLSKIPVEAEKNFQAKRKKWTHTPEWLAKHNKKRDPGSRQKEDLDTDQDLAEFKLFLVELILQEQFLKVAAKILEWQNEHTKV